MDRIGMVIRSYYEHDALSQRALADLLGVSLGTANALVSDCTAKGFLAEIPGTSLRKLTHRITESGIAYLEHYRVDSAVIFADRPLEDIHSIFLYGFECRDQQITFPASSLMPISLRSLNGEVLIERLIRQLREAGIQEITVVVGYMKEMFEYLTERYQVRILYNPGFLMPGTLSSFYCARDYIRGKRVYLLNGNMWLRTSLFHTYECGTKLSSVYKDGPVGEWCLTLNKRNRVEGAARGGENAQIFQGPACPDPAASEFWVSQAEKAFALPKNETVDWESVVLNRTDKPELYAERVEDGQIYLFHSPSELHSFGSEREKIASRTAVRAVAQACELPESCISVIDILSEETESRIYLCDAEGQKLVCRIPIRSMHHSSLTSAASANPFQRRALTPYAGEYAAYNAVRPLHISEKIIAFDIETGYKISRYYINTLPVNLSDPASPTVVKCLKLLRMLHDAALVIDVPYDLDAQISAREQFCGDMAAFLFADYAEMRENMKKIQEGISSLQRPLVLCHNNPSANRFLFLSGDVVRLSDWKNAGMQDPLMDLAMFSLNNDYDEWKTQRILEIYLGRKPDIREQYVTFGLAALGGFLRVLKAVSGGMRGIDARDRTLRMYGFARRYYQIIVREHLDDCIKD
ncbi:MAG: NTP transferase domain-containing protein [Bacillota bacterium]|nr:NTP transferase domain-containing protein [Bacillota bacterium]